MTDQTDIVTLELDQDSSAGADFMADKGSADQMLADVPLNVCWSAQVFKACVRKVGSNRVVAELYLADVKIADAVLTLDNPCFQVRESIGPARVEAEICALFDKREVRVKGKACVAIVCARFDHKILSW